MACVAFVFDRTSLNTLRINRGFISSVLSVLELEALVECVGPQYAYCCAGRQGHQVCTADSELQTQFHLYLQLS